MTDTELAGSSEAMRDFMAQVMEIEGVTFDDQLATVRAFGKLTMPSDQAYALLKENFEDLGHTPLMYHEEGEDHVLAVESDVMAPTRPLWWLASVPLFVITVARLAQLGILQDATEPIASLSDYFSNWAAALPYTGALLGTLLAREIARFLVALWHEQEITLPFFLPLPGLFGLILPILLLLGLFGQIILSIMLIFQMSWGAMGSFAKLRTPVRDRRVAFDMGVAATLAGLAVGIPVLVVGLLGSEVLTQEQIAGMFPPGTVIVQEGNSLLYRGIKLAVFGKWLPAPSGEDVLISTLANAGWVALLITMFNLLPVGSLDGGHIVHGLIGDRAALLRWIVIPLLIILVFFYPGWLLWLIFMLVFVRNPAQVLDEITSLGEGRRALGIAMLVLLVLLFVPVPLRAIFAIVG
jgi:membrane-associated protease RseP (regulator of RpoE activity)